MLGHRIENIPLQPGGKIRPGQPGDHGIRIRQGVPGENLPDPGGAVIADRNLGKRLAQMFAESLIQFNGNQFCIRRHAPDDFAGDHAGPGAKLNNHIGRVDTDFGDHRAAQRAGRRTQRSDLDRVAQKASE
jgi:hypothetical protein